MKDIKYPDKLIGKVIRGQVTKIVFFDDYCKIRAERGKIYECYIVKDTKPHSTLTGALIVKPIKEVQRDQLNCV